MPDQDENEIAMFQAQKNEFEEKKKLFEEKKMEFEEVQAQLLKEKEDMKIKLVQFEEAQSSEEEVSELTEVEEFAEKVIVEEIGRAHV